MPTRAAPAIIEASDMQVMAAAGGTSVRALSRSTSALRQLHPGLGFPKSSATRRSFQRTVQAYEQLFRFIDIEDSKMAPVDGVVYTTTDIVQFVEFTCALQSRPISTLRRIKISGDEGCGILKFSLQLFFDDSYVLNPDIEDRKNDSDSGNLENLNDTPIKQINKVMSIFFMLFIL